MTNQKYKELTLPLADKKVGTEQVVTKSYAVFTTGSAVPQVVRLGILDFGEAERLAQKTGKNASVVEMKTVVRVVRTMVPVTI